MTSRKRAYRKALKKMIKAVEDGHSYVLHSKNGKPVVIALPWRTWRSISQTMTELNTEPYHATHTPAAPAPPEDEARLMRIFGKTSDELADEAEQGILDDDDLEDLDYIPPRKIQ